VNAGVRFFIRRGSCEGGRGSWKSESVKKGGILNSTGVFLEWGGLNKVDRDRKARRVEEGGQQFL